MTRSSTVVKMLQTQNPNDEWNTPAYAVRPLLPYLKLNSNIWCPFDKDDSNYVRILRGAGHIVYNSHIEYGEDFFNFDVKQVDYIISNPPYSKKDQVFEHLFKLDKPFAMLMGAVGLFEGKRHEIFNNKELEIMWLKPRIFFLDDKGEEKGQPPFQNCYVCHKVLPKTLMFVKMDRKNDSDFLIN